MLMSRNREFVLVFGERGQQQGVFSAERGHNVPEREHGGDERSADERVPAEHLFQRRRGRAYC